jgi:nitroimidazol reductase NimA-like FMN-containing flavoprotein (pyridoxamine 5'-phosphate oxidase superfamily)
MVDEHAIEMSAADRDEFLEDGGTGVMSFSTTGTDAPHSIPVSYGYDASESVFYFRLAIGSDSSKGDLRDRAVTFVTHDRDGGHWQSVVASGRLEETTEASIATETLAGLDRVDIPLVDIFGKPPADVTFGFYRLVPDSLTGREESPTET